MEELSSWKGHSFTLLVFAGSVVLCSIFFILGMLVGRTQGQRLAETALSETRAKAAAASEQKTPGIVLREASPPTPNAPAPHHEDTPAAANVINFQVGAVGTSNAADKLLNEVQTRGFPAFILAPLTGDPNHLYRVQVGPYENEAEADMAKRKLESLGYKPIMKR